MANATLTLNAADALADIYDYRRTKFWVVFNTENGRVTDADGVSRLGAGEATPDATGLVTLSGIPIPSGATNPTSFQVKVCYDAPAKASNQRTTSRERGDFGWMTVTGNAVVTDLEAEQYVPPTYAGALISEMEDLRDDAAAAASLAQDVSNIDTPDALVKTLVANPASQTAGALITSTADSLSSPSPVAMAVLEHLVTGVRPELYGAVGDGVTNDSAAFAALLADGHEAINFGPKSYLVNADVINVEHVLGVGSSGYLHGTEPLHYSKIIIASNSGAVGVRIKVRGSIQGVGIYPQNYAALNFQMADYPTATGNVATGLYLEDRGVIARDVLVAGFSQRGFRGGTTSRILSCYVRSCPNGYDLEGSDGWMTDSVAMFCMNNGINGAAAFWRFAGNRIEWNARYGAKSAAHSTWVGNLFDRNGAAGLYLNAGSWGQVVTGNHFHRNGCGGDGALGRWGASVPGHFSYVDTPATESCHIKMDFQRGVTIAGNRYSYGRDDAGQGMQGPANIYSSATTSTGSGRVYVSGNVGERGDTNTIGYVASAYSGIGAIAAGADTVLAAELSRPFSVADGVETAGEVRAAGHGPQRSRSANTSTQVIPLKPGRAGMVMLTARNSAASHLTVIYWSQDTAGGNKTTLVENKIGTFITAATLGNDGTNDTLTLTFTGSRGFNYAIYYSDLA